MVLNIWADALSQTILNMWMGVIGFIPNLIVAVVIFIIGWLIGAGLGRVVRQIVDALRVDAALRSAGVDRLVERAGFSLSSGAFLGDLVEWFVIVIFLVAALQVLGLTQVNDFLKLVVLQYLPQVIAAVLILLVAAVLANAAQGVVAGAAKAGGITSANLLGNIARWAIWIFAVLAALDRLGIAPLLNTLFTGVVIALSLAFGLAFGLGGQQAAARYIEHIRSEIKD